MTGNTKPNKGKDRYLYPWLNSLLLQVTAEPDRQQKPAYAWGVLHGVHLAKMLGHGRVSVIEFGVAAGQGLIALETIAARVERILEVEVDVYGFDTGTGLPQPKDYRDLPNLWAEGYFLMEHEKLRSRLKRAQLILGLVEETIESFINSNPAPVAFIAFDLDIYSSTAHAFRLLKADTKLLLPRVHCYFDDIMGFTFGDHNGERLAIAEFNEAHTHRKISQIYGLKYYLPPAYANQQWVEKSYMAHLLDHELYGHNDGLITKAGEQRFLED